MAPSRQLPTKHNPLMVADVPEFSELVSRRRLGQTQLTARMVAAVSGAEVDPSSLGVFDYAHLRAPLPKGIVSGIFKSSPSSYFLMRRSHDGFVSATGMFKATFPYATADEEESERRYIKSLPTTSSEETAGNVWIPPEDALKLAEEYRITDWILALLDAAEIAVSTGAENTPPKRIAAPPKFNLAPPTPSSLPRSSRAGRSASPTKSTGSKRGTASPKKRSAKISSSSVDLPNGLAPAPAGKGADVLVETLEKEHPVVFAPADEEAKVKINVDQDVKTDASGKPVTHTKVEVELPLPGDPPSGKDVVRMVEEAKEMVKAAAETVASTSPAVAPTKKNKRKAGEIEEEPKENGEGSSSQPSAKRAKTEVELRRERMKKRAFIGISATLAVGAIIPYVMGALS